ncbi:MAG: alpha/beta hydrolase, partial [Myxococcota bacterium]
PYLVPFMSRGTFDANMKRVFGPNTQPSPELLDSMWTLLNVSNGKRAIPDLLSYIRERREQRSRWVGAIQHSRVPVGIINGPADPVSGAHMVERLKEVVDQPLFIETLPDIGHYPQCEAPQAVVEAWRRFVSSTESEA